MHIQTNMTIYIIYMCTHIYSLLMVESNGRILQIVDTLQAVLHLTFSSFNYFSWRSCYLIK